MINTAVLDRPRIAPQPGPQEQFLTTAADIAFYGGAAGGGKTFGLLMEPLYYIFDVVGYGGVIFRRETTQISIEGGLWDESEDLYSSYARPRQHPNFEWIFPNGNTLQFRHMQRESDRLKYQGAQIPFIGFDELTHFTRKQFLYMLSRNRSTCGVRPYMRGTYNPVPPDDPVGGWIHEFVGWYLDENGEYPDPKKSGVLRYFLVVNDVIEWADSAEELLDRFPHIRQQDPDARPLSFTYIPSRVYDNKILLSIDPGYVGRLRSLDKVEQARLLEANHKIRDEKGTMFKREWFEIVDQLPDGCRLVRYWDKAGTQDAGAHTAGVLLAEHRQKDESGKIAKAWYICDLVMGQWGSVQREAIIKQTAVADAAKWGYVVTGVEQEPGSGGKESAEATIRNNAGYTFFADRPTGEKALRAEPVASQASIGNVKMLSASWNGRMLEILTAFPFGIKDPVDALSGAFKRLLGDSGAPVGETIDIDMTAYTGRTKKGLFR